LDVESCHVCSANVDDTFRADSGCGYFYCWAGRPSVGSESLVCVNPLMTIPDEELQVERSRNLTSFDLLLPITSNYGNTFLSAIAYANIVAGHLLL